MKRHIFKSAPKWTEICLDEEARSTHNISVQTTRITSHLSDEESNNDLQSFRVAGGSVAEVRRLGILGGVVPQVVSTQVGSLPPH